MTAVGCASVSPVAMPAVRWPRGSELMPARTCSATRTEVKIAGITAGTYEPKAAAST